MARLNPGQAFSGINNCDVFRGLIFKNPKFGRAIFGDGAVTIEMIGGEVEPKCDGWPKSFDCFQLKRTHFDCEHVELFFFPRDFRERLADVAASDCPLSARVQHLRKQLGRGRLAVRARDGDDWEFAGPPAELELAHHVDLA